MEAVTISKEFSADVRADADNKAAAAVNGDAAAKAQAVAAQEIAAAVESFDKDVRSAAGGNKQAALRVGAVVKQAALVTKSSDEKVLETLKKSHASSEKIAQAQNNIDKVSRTISDVTKGMDALEKVENEASAKVAITGGINRVETAKTRELISKYVMPALMKDDFYANKDDQGDLFNQGHPSQEPQDTPNLMMPSH